MERPALKQLLHDVEAGKINVIVVYKVDRLTRSLADFAKEVTGERIRDKIAASKRKGMWTGGMIPLATTLKAQAGSESERGPAGLKHILPLSATWLRLKTGQATRSREDAKQSLGHANRYSAWRRTRKLELLAHFSRRQGADQLVELFS